MKVLFAAAASAIMAGSLFSAEALKPASVADFTGYTRSAKNIENGIRFTGTRYLSYKSAKSIPIDLKKKYRISCEYRMAPGSKSAAHLYFAPISYDKNGQEISATGQYCIRGTETVLAAPAKKGDKVVKIKNGAKWFVQWGAIAFNAKSDFSDLPNNDFIYISAIKKNGDVWEVSLKNPLAKDYPAGTSVREQRAGASYRYIFYAKPQTEWTKSTQVIRGEKSETAPGYANAWRLGTVKAGIVFFTNGSPIDIEIRNISIVEEK